MLISVDWLGRKQWLFGQIRRMYDYHPKSTLTVKTIAEMRLGEVDPLSIYTGESGNATCLVKFSSAVVPVNNIDVF